MKSNINMIAMGCKPDPYKFKIKELVCVNGYTIVLANYDGCKTFNGDKMMMFKGEFREEDFKTLDPHFLDETYPLVARFIPNRDGWLCAIQCAKNFSFGKENRID